MKIITFNLLAPIYAQPIWYPIDLNAELLKTENRIPILINYINTLKNDADIFCFQEVQESIFAILEKQLDGFVGYNNYHDPKYWANWIIPPVEYTPNGNAVFVRKSILTGVSFKDIPLSDTGNHCIMTSFIHKDTNKRIKIYCVHFDADLQQNREIELESLLNRINSGNKNDSGNNIVDIFDIVDIVDIVVGDYNFDMNNKLKLVLDKNKFIDIIDYKLNNNITIPFQNIYYKSHNYTVIDHILSKNIRYSNGEVLGYSIIDIENKLHRIEQTLSFNGSDHFAVYANIEF